MVKHIHNLQSKLVWSAYSFFICYFCLLSVLCYWNLTRSEGILWPVWVLQCLPLLLFLPGLIKPFYRSYSWFCFLLLLYFIAATENSFKSTAGATDYLFLTFTVLLFIVSMLRSRWLQFATHQSEEKEKSSE